MIKAVCFFDKDGVLKTTKKQHKWNTVIVCGSSIILTLISICCIVGTLLSDGPYWFSLIVEFFMLIFSPIPFINAMVFYIRKKKYSANDYGVEEYSITKTYKFEEYKIIFETLQNEKSIVREISIKNVSFVDDFKDGINFYVNGTEMYHLNCENFVEGTKDDLVMLFRKNFIKIKKC